MTLATKLPAALRQLPPLPQALNAALGVIRNPRSSRADLVRVLTLDQSMAGLFLRMVNSAYYHLPRRISSLDEAVGYLGYETVESVILAVAGSKFLSGPIPAYKLERGALWQHSVAVAIGAEWAAKKCRIALPSEAYLAGLLHDVGLLVMDLTFGHQSSWASVDDFEHQSWVEVERQIADSDHAAVGAMVVRGWNLSERVAQATAWHHEPMNAESERDLASLIHIVNHGSIAAGLGLWMDANARADPGALELLKWTPADDEALQAVMTLGVASAKETLNMR